VDCRSKKWGFNHRRSFNQRTQAEKYAKEIDAERLDRGKRDSSTLLYQSKDIARLDSKLKPLGKSLDDAVNHYIQHIHEEAKKALIPSIKELCLEWYQSKCNSKNKPISEKTKRALKIYWKFITRKLGKFKPTEVTYEMAEKLVESVDSGETNVTRKHYMRHIRMFFNWCVKRKYIRDNPTAGIQVQIKRNEIQILSPDEVERLLRLCETKYPSLLGYYCLTIFGGLRPSEAERCEWADINFDGKQIFVKPEGKTGSRRFRLKETDSLWIWLEHIKMKFPEQPLNPTKNHENMQKKVRQELGKWIQDGLRHSFGTFYHGLTRNIPEVVYVMGNSIEISKRHYVREVSVEWVKKYWDLKPSEG